MFTSSVYIGPEFFAKAKADYANWHWALVREFLQNCADAPDSRHIHATITANADATTTLTIANDGAPMDRDTLVNKLLALGGTGKGFNGTVGGFGKAKELLYFTHVSYEITTGCFHVAGAGAGYSLTDVPYHAGTTSTIIMTGNHQDAITAHFGNFVRLCQWSGAITLNGTALDERLKKGARRRDLDWGTIYTNNSDAGLLVARIGGLPMFTKHINYKGVVLVELTGNSGDILTSNRDGLKYKYQAELDDFIQSISTNARKAFKEPKAVEKKIYPGYKLAGKITTIPTATDAVGQDIGYVLAARIAATTAKAVSADAPAISIAQIQKVLHPEFRVRNELVGTIPAWFLPGPGFSDNSKRLISNWIALLVEMACMTQDDRPFAVGFCFDADARALYERDGGATTIYVNPVEVVEKPGKPRQLKTYWKFSAAGNWELLSVAAHEFCHHLTGGDHTEEYANRLTDLFSQIMASRTRFSRHFNSQISWPD